METIQEWLPRVAAFMTESKIIGAGIIMGVSLIAAKLVDLFLDRVVVVFTKKSRFHLDDAILEVFHRFACV